MNDTLTEYLKQAAEGDQDAFTKFAKAVAGRILSIATRVSGDSHYAEDVLNIVLLKIWENLGKVAKLKKPIGYVNTIAYNAAIDFKRKAIRELPLCETIPAPAPDAELRMDVEAALGRLTGEEREIVLYHVHANLSFRKIADLLGISKKAVYLRYKKAAGKMRGVLTAVLGEQNGCRSVI